MSGENPLSEREREILQLVAEGLTNREIAQRLSISHNTVKVHLSNIFEKTGVASRTEATLYAIEQRIVAVPGGEEAQSESKKTLWTYISNHPWISLVSSLLIIAILSTVFITIFNSLQDEEVEPVALNRWQELTPMPEARIGLAAVAYDNQIYAIAGKGKEGVSGSVFRYDIEGDSWDRLLDKPTPVTDVGGVLIGEQIYIPGGLGANGNPVDVLEIYDPRHDTWSVGAPMPEALSAYAIADFEGKMYLFGGWDGENAVGDVWVYDPTEDEWGNGIPAIERFSFAKAILVNDRIILLGGEDDQNELISRSYSFFPYRDDGTANVWEDFVAIPEGRSNFGVGSVIGSIYIIGGYGNGNQMPSIFFNGDQWIALSTNKDYSAHYVAMVSVGSFFVILDTDSDFVTTSLNAFNPLFFDTFLPIIP